MKNSIIIPHFDPDNKMTGYLDRCLASIKKNSVDYEIILIDSLKSYSENVNLGLKKSKGDFIVVLNNDTEIKDKKWLEKLYTKSKISSWRLELHTFYIPQILKLIPDGSCWGMPREVFNKLGYLDEIFSEGYGFEDTDYWMRAKKIGIKFKDAKVNMIHYKNKTFNTYFDNDFIFQRNHNENLFLEKYKLI